MSATWIAVRLCALLLVQSVSPSKIITRSMIRSPVPGEKGSFQRVALLEPSKPSSTPNPEIISHSIAPPEESTRSQEDKSLNHGSSETDVLEAVRRVLNPTKLPIILTSTNKDQSSKFITYRATSAEGSNQNLEKDRLSHPVGPKTEDFEAIQVLNPTRSPIISSLTNNNQSPNFIMYRAAYLEDPIRRLDKDHQNHPGGPRTGEISLLNPTRMSIISSRTQEDLSPQYLGYRASPIEGSFRSLEDENSPYYPSGPRNQELEVVQVKFAGPQEEEEATTTELTQTESPPTTTEPDFDQEERNTTTNQETNEPNGECIADGVEMPAKERTRLYPVGRLWEEGEATGEETGEEPEDEDEGLVEEKAEADIWSLLHVAYQCLISANLHCFSYRVYPMFRSYLGLGAPPSLPLNSYPPQLLPRGASASTDLSLVEKDEGRGFLGGSRFLKELLLGLFLAHTSLIPWLGGVGLASGKALLTGFLSLGAAGALAALDSSPSAVHQRHRRSTSQPFYM